MEYFDSMIGLIALCHEDGSWDASDDELKHVLWAGSGRRCITNSTRWFTGDGVIAGKEASSQEAIGAAWVQLGPCHKIFILFGNLIFIVFLIPHFGASSTNPHAECFGLPSRWFKGEVD
ncbi:Essential protein Yae1 [Prunus dulcis]|uniref:Essential protein Yae1 n=1 Tax=Prunus dulcis TaxID=3755 RepID=A0A4Y1RRG5_PRUDU|nr:Essential protein Yae1 [Prunus dulcis]